MASSTAEPDWQACLNVWSCEQGEAFLTSEPEEGTSLLRTGSVQQLLDKTQQLLEPALMKDRIGFKQASAAVGAKVVVLLARLLHKLQETPSGDMNSASASKPYKSVWYCVLEAFGAIVEAMQVHAMKTTVPVNDQGMPVHEEPLVVNCRQQLQEAGGGY